LDKATFLAILESHLEAAMTRVKQEERESKIPLENERIRLREEIEVHARFRAKESAFPALRLSWERSRAPTTGVKSKDWVRLLEAEKLHKEKLAKWRKQREAAVAADYAQVKARLLREWETMEAGEVVGLELGRRVGERVPSCGDQY